MLSAIFHCSLFSFSFSFATILLSYRYATPSVVRRHTTLAIFGFRHSAKTPAGRAARGGKERGSPPTQPRPAFGFVSERLLFSELIVFIKRSEPDAFFLTQILTITPGLFRRRIPQELPPRAARPAGAFTANVGCQALLRCLITYLILIKTYAHIFWGQFFLREFLYLVLIRRAG